MRTVGTFIKGLKLIEYIASCAEGAKLNDAARFLNIPSSNLTLFMNTLLERGYVLKNDVSGRYHLSTKLEEIAEQAQTDIYEDLKNIAKPEMEELHKTFDENIILSIIQKMKLKSIYELKSTQSIQIINQENEWFTPHLTAAGKVMLAYSGSKNLEVYLDECSFQRPTETSLKNKSELKKQLSEIQKNGFALNLGEYDLGIYGIAAPIFLGNKIMASVVVQYPHFRHEESCISEYSYTIKNTAEKISGKLMKVLK